MNILYDMDQTSADRKLVENAASKISETMKLGCRNVLLKPLGRFGRTSANLYTFQMKMRGGQSTIPFVAKIDTSKNIERDRKNTEKVKSFFSHIPTVEFSNTEDSRGILVFRSAGDQELKFALDQCKGRSPNSKPKARNLARVRKLVRIALNGLPGPENRRTHDSQRIKNRETFKQYLRKNIGIENMRKYFSSHSDFIPGITSRPKIRWKDLDDHIRKFLNHKPRLTVGPIHGDLHPSNIMVDTSNNDAVSLIDFAWATNDGIAAIDYAMMENSIHYMWAPFWLPERFWKTIDKYMLGNLVLEDDCKIQFLKMLGEDECLRGWGKAVWEVMMDIRKAAKKNGIMELELYTARAALLLGQAKFEVYAPPRIGAQLWRLLDKLPALK